MGHEIIRREKVDAQMRGCVDAWMRFRYALRAIFTCRHRRRGAKGADYNIMPRSAPIKAHGS